MDRKKLERLFPLFLAGCVIILAFGGCTQGHLKMETLLDSPEHHVSTGFRLLDRNRIADAEREFKLALHLDGSNSGALCGLGLIYAKNGNFLQAMRSLQAAEKNATRGSDRTLIHVGYMRVLRMQKGKDWLKNVVKNFDDAVDVAGDFPDAHFYLGMAFKEAYQFRRARKEFNKVKEYQDRLFEEADRELKTVSKIIMARPGSMAGKQIAMLTKITRAETTTLLVEELELNKLLAKSNSGVSQEPSPSVPLVSDWAKHPRKKDIDAILALNIEGLKRAPGGSFLPDQNITRAEYAMVMGDVMVKLKKDPTMATRFTGKRSPFSDVRNDEPYFTAVMLCTEGTGIMEPEYGVYNPAGAVTGPDALLIIRRLKEALKVY